MHIGVSEDVVSCSFEGVCSRQSTGANGDLCFGLIRDGVFSDPGRARESMKAFIMRGGRSFLCNLGYHVLCLARSPVLVESFDSAKRGKSLGLSV